MLDKVSNYVLNGTNPVTNTFTYKDRDGTNHLINMANGYLGMQGY